MTQVVTLGEALGLVRGAGVGGLDQLGDATLSVGGAELNVAIALARLGVQTSWLGRVGEDPFGRRIERELRAEGVTAFAIPDPARTAIMLKEQLPLGRTRVTFYRDDSAGSHLAPQDLDAIDIEAAALLHVTGIAAGLSATASSTIRRAVERAATAGRSVSFDVNHRPTVWAGQDSAAEYRWLAERSTVVFGGRDELELLVGSHNTDYELARAVSALGPSEVVVKRGSDGAAAVARDEWTELPSLSVRVVDTVGAGDLFVAAYLATRLAGGSAADRLAAAVTNGAAACTHPGDWEGALSEIPLSASLTDPVER